MQPMALKTLGPINSTGISFLTELGRRLTGVSGDSRETMHLFQRVSLPGAVLGKKYLGGLAPHHLGGNNG